MTTSGNANGFARTGISLFVLALMAALIEPPSASAADDCIQDVWKAHGNNQDLTCTANDVRIAEVTNICAVDADGNLCCQKDGCQPSCIEGGGDITFEADFKVLLTATARYDVGLYLGTDGDPNGNGALTGECTSDIITPAAEVPPSTFVNPDRSPDQCGDIDSAHNPQILRLEVTTACVGDSNRKLKLPNCTTWRQPGSNEVCTTAYDAYPGSPSKCNCQPGFTINIDIEHPTISVTKSAAPSSVQEPGGDVAFTVTVTNEGAVSSITLTTIIDDPDNDPSTTDDVAYDAAEICGTTTLAPKASAECTFTRTISGIGGDSFTDKACVHGTDASGAAVGPTCDTATVSISEAPTSAAITKGVQKAICAVVRYDVKVENTSTFDSLHLTSLCDDKFGDVSSGQASSPACGPAPEHGALRGGTAIPCELPQTLSAGGGSYSCTFDALVCDFTHTNIVTGTLLDDDGNPVTPTGDNSATVTSVGVN